LVKGGQWDKKFREDAPCRTCPPGLDVQRQPTFVKGEKRELAQALTGQLTGGLPKTKKKNMAPGETWNIASKRWGTRVHDESMEGPCKQENEGQH